jgi:hypothetical protein
VSAINVLSWVLSFITAYATFALGWKWRHAWMVSAVSQLGWGYMGVMTGAWGMLPLAVTMFGLNVYNWIKWGKQ